MDQTKFAEKADTRQAKDHLEKGLNRASKYPDSAKDIAPEFC